MQKCKLLITFLGKGDFKTKKDKSNRILGFRTIFDIFLLMKQGAVSKVKAASILLIFNFPHFVAFYVICDFI
jgi:hypothetical protein